RLAARLAAARRLRRRGLRLGRQGALQQLGDVERLHAARLAADRFHALVEHLQAERAGRSQHVGAGVQRLGRADVVDALAALLFHEGVAAAGATAETLVAAARHLDLRRSRQRGHYVARLVVHLVVATEVAGVVVGDRLVQRLGRLKAPLAHQLGQELAVVDDLVAAAER